MMQTVIRSPKLHSKIRELQQEILILEKLNKFLEMKVNSMTKVEDSPSSWERIEDNSVILKVLTSYADPNKKLILEATKEKPLTVQEIIQKTNLSQTSTYRMCNELVNNNMLRKVGLVLSKDGKRVPTYSPSIRNMRIYFEENDLLMFLMLEK